MKKNIWLTADLHLFHTNIIKFCNRPFSSVEEMNNTLVTKWNCVVGEYEIVYVLGDFSLGTLTETSEVFSKLNGNIVIITGDHDYWIKDLERKYPKSKNGNEVTIMKNQLYEFGYLSNYVTLCHYPMRSWRRKFHGSYHFYGHVHGKLPQFERSMDVGVDTNNFYPISVGGAIAQIDLNYNFVPTPD